MILGVPGKAEGMTAPAATQRPRATSTRPNTRFALLGHSPALDGLRGLAVLLVVAYHFVGHHVLVGGWVGVDVFFVLSGFLITALLLDERRVHGRVDVRRFYARRAARLLPALVLVLGIWSVLLLLFHGQGWLSATPSGDGRGRSLDVASSFGDIGIALGYGANWIYATGGGEAPLAHLWSLAVEEQFYLLWPATLLALLTLSGRVKYTVAAALVILSATLPWLYWNGGEGQNRIYFGTDTRAVGLLAGALAALLWHRRRSAGRPAVLARSRAIIGLAAVALVACYVGNEPAKFVLMPALMALAVSQVVPHLAEGGGRLGRLLGPRWLLWAGRRSYALYLWHYLWATWTHPLPMQVGVPLGIAGAVASTELSWRLVEQPILLWARRFRVPTAATTRRAPDVVTARAA